MCKVDCVATQDFGDVSIDEMDGQGFDNGLIMVVADVRTI